MPPDDSAAGYIIWGADHRPYGPVELPELVSWIKDERVTAETWVYLERSDCWEKASHLPELQMFFHGRHTTAPNQSSAEQTSEALNPSAFRHIRLLAGLNDEQLDQFLHLMQVGTVPAGTHLVRQNEPANAMHLLLEGELRARANVEGRDTSIGTLGAGEFFGELSLFDQGPRTAEITASQESTVMKIPAADFEKLTHEKPELAAPFLFALTKTLAARIRADHKRYRDSVSFIHPPVR
jgi:CRP-like cAMP-binding protein